MKSRIMTALLFVSGAVSIVTGNAKAFSAHLSDTERSEALYYGAKNAKADSKQFYKEWTFDKGDKGVAILNSPFLTLASASKDAVESGDELDSDAIEDTLARAQGKLVFTVYLYGAGQDFAKDYVGLVKAGNKVYPATYSEDGEVTPSETRPGKFVQEIFYYFSMDEISPNAAIVLEIGDPKQKDKVQFEIDLKKVK